MTELERLAAARPARRRGAKSSGTGNDTSDTSKRASGLPIEKNTNVEKVRENLSGWIERNICLPDTTAEPGPITLAPYMREIANAIGDPAVERVSVLKSARIGYTTVLTAAIGYHVVADPAPILCLLPTEADCRDYLVGHRAVV